MITPVSDRLRRHVLSALGIARRYRRDGHPDGSWWLLRHCVLPGHAQALVADLRAAYPSVLVVESRRPTCLVPGMESAEVRFFFDQAEAAGCCEFPELAPPPAPPVGGPREDLV